MHVESLGNTVFVYKTADSPQLLEEIFRLRFHVYCRECNFIKPEDYPDCIEKDKYDPFSVQFLVEDGKEVVGSARLILDSPLGFPIEEHCKEKLTVDPSTITRSRIAEVSRLVISKTYRRRKDDGLYYAPDCQDSKEQGYVVEGNHLRRIRPMAFGLYRELYQESKRRGITHWYALMEVSLWTLLRLHHIVFYPIGDEIDFYGPVRPYLASIEEIERTLNEKNPNFFYQYLLEGLEPEYRPRSMS